MLDPDRSPAQFAASIRRHLRTTLALEPRDLSPRDLFWAAALATRDVLFEGMLETAERQRKADAKRIYYLSAEFLVGRALGNNLINLGLLESCREALRPLGDLSVAFAAEPDAALGNGGLGRLAACFLDSMATLDLPGFGYGIHYEYGLFRQEFDNGEQREQPDNWLAFGSPWQVERWDDVCVVPIYGRIEESTDAAGRYNPMWLDWRTLLGVPYDVPVVGYGGRTTNFLRLFAARASNVFDMQTFHAGEYVRAVEERIATETVSKVLYPSDRLPSGRELRLVQEYFLVACAVRDVVRHYLRDHDDLRRLPEKAAVQLNDTHPALAVVELLRLLIDEHDLPWEAAWDVVERTFAFTNHTLMPEALERWPTELLARVLPRHLQLLYEINRRFLERIEVRWPGDLELRRRVSLFEEGAVQQARMAHLAIVGSHSVNGVAALHSELVQRTLVPDFHAFAPQKFNNKTNGVTPRRWILAANPSLGALLGRRLGAEWPRRLELLRGLETLAADAGLQEEWVRAKLANKRRLADLLRDTCRVNVDPAALFDIQAKRIHEYKRQLLNGLHVARRYLELVEDGRLPTVPKVYVFAGKAAPGYVAAKRIIRLLNGIAQTVNADARTRDVLRVAFVPDYRVSLAEILIPAGDLSEQISTAGTEASGTGNMKFALNGALTIGTRDGATVEMAEAIGAENLFLFGLDATAIARFRSDGSYCPAALIDADPALRRVLDAIVGGRFSADDRDRFAWLREVLIDGPDEYFLAADFGAYCAAQECASQCYAQPAEWRRRSILNTARMAKFSSDRAVTEYAQDIWQVGPV